MRETNRPPLSDAEREVLRVLWDHGPGTVREVNALLEEQGRRWAYTTVITLLQRLQAKGYVASDTSGFAHVFRAAVSRDAVLRQRLTDLADEFCEGTAAPLVLALVEGQRLSHDELQQLRELIDRHGATPVKTKMRLKRKGKEKNAK
jgi:BlaI family penicillinase repressor